MKSTKLEYSVIAAIWGLLFLVPANGQSLVFYGGDKDGAGVVASSLNPGGGSQSLLVLDDFMLASPTTIKKIWGNYYAGSGHLPTSPQSAYYEIRQDVAVNGGSLVTSGYADFTLTPTGRFEDEPDFPEFQLAATVNFELAPGTYWLGIAPNDISAYLQTTSGGDSGPVGDPNPAPIGSPRDNGNAYQEWTFGIHSTSWIGTISQGNKDFSYGIEAVPEPDARIWLAGALVLVAFATRAVKKLRTVRAE